MSWINQSSIESPFMHTRQLYTQQAISISASASQNLISSADCHSIALVQRR
jgi:hypothetical protein